MLVLTATLPPTKETEPSESFPTYSPQCVTWYIHPFAPASCYISFDGEKKGNFEDKTTMSPSDEPFTIRTPATAPTQFTTAITVNTANSVRTIASSTDSTATPITTPPSTPSSTPWSTPWSTPLNTPFTTPITTPKTSPTSLFIICVEYKQWKITVPEGNYVEMTIKNINLRPWACLFETYIMVRDGHSLSDNVLRILCEASTSPYRITSSGNKMIVERYGTLGTSEGAGFEASFKAKPLKTGDSPSFGVAEETVALLEHCSQSLLCQAGGAPAPRITWSKNGEVLQNSTSVTYTPRWHSKSGNYTCRASNFNGSDTKTILVHTEKCSRFCNCLKLNSHPFWFRVYCWPSSDGTVPRDVPLATKYLFFFVYTSLWHISPKSFENLTDLQYL
ncbi:unnamed protein product [Pocillopora meandrina]|uniref:Ig-like domain-containing protein n=1 Tax=Pocillopora meandrina TaxID=46732 RepID=A0AAU9W4J6_9CNID|nr:unnamed protein product [Pocillopora meandrina]